MRVGALVICVVAALVAAYLGWLGPRSPFFGHSGEQLQILEQAYQKVARSRPVETLSPPPRAFQRSVEKARAAAEDATVAVSLIQDEHRRRRYLLGAIAIGSLGLIALALTLLRAPRTSSAEANRFARAVGTPEAALGVERQRAAHLLGVAVDASAHVVEAALAAQLALRDPARLEGMAPELRRLAEEHRKALLQARNCLIGRPTPSSRATAS